MLSLFSKHITKNHIGLYRDGGLAILKKASVPEGKNLINSYKTINAQYNPKIINYFDLILNLNDRKYPICRKPKEETNHIYVNSDHPPLIIKEIPQPIEKRLSILSPSKNVFQESAIYNEKYLKNWMSNNQNKKKRV